MSIEMENPKTPLELVDAARNHVAQIRIAMMVGDRRKMEQQIEKAEERLFTLQLEIEKSES